MAAPKPLFSLLSAALLFALSGTGQASMRDKPDLFFKPAPGVPESLPADELPPKGRMFLFSFYSVGGGTEEKLNALYPEEVVQQAFERHKKAGFTTIGPQYELSRRALADAEQHNFTVVYDVGLEMNFHGKGASRR